LVIECDTAYGKRWYHYAHCQEIKAEAKTVSEGEVIGKLGKSGTTYAHLHFAVFKVNPSEIGGIDVIAKTQDQLNKWWEDPFLTLNTKTESTDMIPNYLKTLLQEANIDINNEGQFRAFWEKAIKYDNDVRALQEQVKSANEALSDRALEVSTLTEKNQKLSDRASEAEEEVNRLRGERDKATWENTQLTIKVEALEEEIDRLHREIEQHQNNNDIFAYSWLQRWLSLFKRG
jgi:FtsZ-binding cell division protein ZapB